MVGSEDLLNNLSILFNLIALLLGLVIMLAPEGRKQEGKILAKVKIVYQDKITFGGHEVFFQLVEADGYTIELIESEADADRPNATTARVALLQRVIHKLKVDGDDINLEPDPRGKSQFPKIWDGKETLTTYLLKIIINNTEPELAEQFEKFFGKYLKEEDVSGFTEPSVHLSVAEE